MRNAYGLLIEPEGKGSLGRPRSTWVYNIKIFEIEWSGEWIGMAQDKEKWRVLMNKEIYTDRRPPLVGQDSVYFCW